MKQALTAGELTFTLDDEGEDCVLRIDGRGLIYAVRVEPGDHDGRLRQLLCTRDGPQGAKAIVWQWMVPAGPPFTWLADPTRESALYCTPGRTLTLRTSRDWPLSVVHCGLNDGDKAGVIVEAGRLRHMSNAEVRWL